MDAYIAYGTYWSSPFVKWQGSLASQHPLVLAANTAKEVFAETGADTSQITSLLLGFTVPFKHSFYGAPWVASMIGLPGITGPTIMQACATGARCLGEAGAAVTAKNDDCVLVVAADRTSNGPHLHYPDSNSPGGRGESEDWVWDSFNLDPVPRNAMVQTAENVAKEGGITRAQQDEMTLLRYKQYGDALADGGAFHKRFLRKPYVVKDGRGKPVVTIDGDEGVFPTTPEGLAKLQPVLKEGTVTFGSQTHPADGNAGLIVATKDKAAALAKDKKITVRLASFAQANAKKGFMAQAVVPAARLALERAGFTIGECVVKTHNPFAVNDVYFAREMGIAPESFNRFGSPLVFGHPQGPTGVRCVIELIEELAMKGGGRGLFAGCAAGDTAAAVCVEVGA